MATCRVCRGEYDPDAAGSCSRCGSRPVWEDIDSTLFDFLFSWSTIWNLCIVLLVFLVWYEFPTTRENNESLFHWIFLPIAIGGVVIMPIGLYQRRWDWWEQQWAAEIYKVTYISPTVLMVDILSLIVLTGLGSYAIFKIWGNIGTAEDILWWQKVIFGGTHSLFYASLSSIVPLYRIGELLEQLRNGMSQPIYVNTMKLQFVVLKEALQMLECVGEDDEVPLPGRPHRWKILEVIQQMDKKQFYMRFGLVDGQGAVLARPNELAQARNRREWEVVTDRWGRIKYLCPKNPSVVFTPG